MQRVEIGEECSYRVRTGGWFGFETPGFTLIEVEQRRGHRQSAGGPGLRFLDRSWTDEFAADRRHLADGQPCAADAERLDCAGRALYLEFQPDLADRSARRMVPGRRHDARAEPSRQHAWRTESARGEQHATC